MNTLQFIYLVFLIGWRPHNYNTSHVVKDFTLVLIKHAEFWRQNFDQEPVGM